IVAGVVEGRRRGLALGIGRVEDLLLGVLQPALDGPQALGGVAPLRFLLSLRSWSIRHAGVLLRLPWFIRVVPGHTVWVSGHCHVCWQDCLGEMCRGHAWLDPPSVRSRARRVEARSTRQTR